MVRAIYSVAAIGAIAAVLGFFAAIGRDDAAALKWEVEEASYPYWAGLREEAIWALAGPELWFRQQQTQTADSWEKSREAAEAQIQGQLTKVWSFYDQTVNWLTASAEGAAAPSTGDKSLQEVEHKLRLLMKQVVGGGPHALGSDAAAEARLAVLRPIVASVLEEAKWFSYRRIGDAHAQATCLAAVKKKEDDAAASVVRKAVTRLPEAD